MMPATQPCRHTAESRWRLAQPSCVTYHSATTPKRLLPCPTSPCSTSTNSKRPGTSGPLRRSGEFEDDTRFSAAEKWALRYARELYRNPENVDTAFYAEGKRYYSEAQIIHRLSLRHACVHAHPGSRSIQAVIVEQPQPQLYSRYRRPAPFPLHQTRLHRPLWQKRAVFGFTKPYAPVEF